MCGCALVTGPVQRFARQIAGQGYICAAPSSFHGFEGPEPLAYDGPGTDRGNELKITKEVASYDEDARLSVDALLALKTCNGKVGATGMCLGGHLAYRAALDGRVSAAVCYFATDIHGHSLGFGKCDDSLQRVGEIAAELALVCSPPPSPPVILVSRAGEWIVLIRWMGVGQIFGKLDNHVPPAGRDLIRKTLHDAGTRFSFYEFAWAQHAYASLSFLSFRNITGRNQVHTRRELQGPVRPWRQQSVLRDLA